jgi:hypothetical protein
MKLEGKRVLITGGSSGIGLAIARALLAKGARIAISGRRAAFVSAAVDELGKAGGSVTGIAADVGRPRLVALGTCPCVAPDGRPQPRHRGAELALGLFHLQARNPANHRKHGWMPEPSALGGPHGDPF